jgi:hypothetical protein
MVGVVSDNNDPEILGEANAGCKMQNALAEVC